MIASGAVVAPALLIPRKTFFLPPPRGWISPIAKVDITSLELPSYMDGIRSGKYSFDKIHEPGKYVPAIDDAGRYHYVFHEPDRGTISMWWEDPVEMDGKFHSQYTGRAYDWDALNIEHGRLSRRAMIDDNLTINGLAVDGMTADQIRSFDQRNRNAGISGTGYPICPPLPAPAEPPLISDTVLADAQAACRELAEKRAAQIRAMA